MRPLKIAIQGIAASYHHEAARLYFKDDFEIVECNTFKNVCMRLAYNDIDYAVMAIENSIAGSILPNYNLIKEYGFSIIGEIYLHIGFHLLANKNVAISDIRCIESHPMAIAQCSGFLSKYPDIVVVAGDDTASVARKISREKSADRAAIAGTSAATVYGLDVLEENIEDTRQNYTRFLIIAKHSSFEEKADKSTISFELPNSLGELSEVLKLVAEHDCNLTKIQSVPVVGKPNEYSFYLDLEWNSAEEYSTLLKEIEAITLNFAVLGRYIKHQIETVRGSLPKKT